uniref:Ribonuclease P protein component 4 n=1 Tax=Bursaphelenchus xylophilus TaxID=6326 RepID=A0A1I7S8U7_BURXY
MSALRISYLEQSAALMAQTGASTSDYYDKISSHFMTQLKEFGYVGQIKADQGIKRSQCKKCRHYLVPKSDGSIPMIVTKQKKRIVRTCLNCNHRLSYVHNPEYQSRNERKSGTS